MLGKIFVKYHERIKIFTDGAINPDLGVCGLAAIFFDEQEKLLDAVYATCLDKTNNEAEYLAVILALKSAEHNKYRNIDIYTDSQILVHHATGLASVKAPGLKKLYHELIMNVRNFESVNFHHIPRCENQIADAFANQAILLWKRKG